MKLVVTILAHVLVIAASTATAAASSNTDNSVWLKIEQCSVDRTNQSAHSAVITVGNDTTNTIRLFFNPKIPLGIDFSSSNEAVSAREPFLEPSIEEGQIIISPGKVFTAILELNRIFEFKSKGEFPVSYSAGIRYYGISDDLVNNKGKLITGQGSFKVRNK